jgi:hypothetical protein
MSHIPNLEKNTSFLVNINSAIEEAEQHLFCRRLVVHNKIMANFLHNLVEKVEPFLANRTFGDHTANVSATYLSLAGHLSCQKGSN